MHKTIIKLLLLIGFTLKLSTGFTQDSYQQLKDSLDVAREANDYSALAQAYYDIAIYEEKVNQNPELAFEQISRSLEYYELIKDSIGLMHCKYHIARQLFNNGMEEDAFNRIQELMPYYTRQKNERELALLHLQEYRYYFDKVEVDSCSVKLLKLQDYFKNNDDLSLELEYLYHKVSFNELLQNYDQAFINAELCVTKSKELGDNLALAKCLKSRGQIALKRKEVYRALFDLQSALQYLNSVPYSQTRLVIYNLISECYNSLDNYKRAYQYKEHYAALQDSILNERRIIAVNNLSYKYESQEKATEIMSLEKDKIFVEQSNQQQKRALVILGITLAGLLLGIYYIIRFYTDKIKSSKIIEEQDRKINQQKINELQDKIQINSMQSMIAGQEVERERIAKDLHDSLGGLLSTIKLQIGNLGQADDQNPDLQKATNLLDVAVSEVRTISQDLQPGALKRLGLVPAINDLVNRYQSSNGPDITFQHFDLPTNISQTFAMGIYRIVQEILNNAIKHAKSTEIFIQLNMEGKDLVIHIEDDGIGFNPDQKFKSMGLENIKSRVNYLKGSIDIDSRINEGTSFIIHIDSHFNKEV